MARLQPTKRTGAWLLAMVLVMAMILGACSSGNNNTSNNGNNGTSTPPTSNTGTGGEGNNGGTDSGNAGGEEPNQEPVTLRLLTWADDTYKELYDKFTERYPWITIEAVRVEANDDQIMEKIASLEAAGTPADLTWISGDLLRYNQGGLLEDLTPYLEADASFQEKVLPDGFFDTMEFNGKKLAVPFVDVPMWVLVNKDLLEKHGVEMPGNDWTYDDFRRIAKEVTDPEAGEYGLTTNGEFVRRMLSAKSVADGHAPNLAYMNQDLTQSLLNTPDIMNDLRWMQEFITKDGSQLNYADNAAQGDVLGQFINGKAAFEIGGDWVLPGLHREAQFNWDVLPFPRGKVTQVTYHIYGPLALLSGSQNKDAAYKYISFQFEMEAQKWKIEKGANASVQDPELTAYIDQVPLWEGKNIEAVKLTKDMGMVGPGATIPGFSEYQWADNIINIILGGGDLNEVIATTEAWNKRTLELREQMQ